MVETTASFYGSLLHLDFFLLTLPDSIAGNQHQVFKCLSIKKPWIRLSGPCTVTRLIRIARNGDFLSHLEAHLEPFRELIAIPPELVGSRRTVERRIIPDGTKQRLPFVLILAVLPETFLCERTLGVGPVIDLPVPAFVGPGGAAKANKR